MIQGYKSVATFIYFHVSYYCIMGAEHLFKSGFQRTVFKEFSFYFDVVKETTPKVAISPWAPVFFFFFLWCHFVGQSRRNLWFAFCFVNHSHRKCKLKNR